MATNTLTQNINQAINDFKGVRQALMDKGVEIPSGTPTSQYGAKIGEIQTGGGEQPTKGYQVTEWDSNGFPLKVKLYGMTEMPAYYFSCILDGGGFKKLYAIDDWSNITIIRKYAFYNCESLALTSLPEGITSIDESAFRSCHRLALTSLPDSITSIGQYAFNGCTSLALTSLPEGIKSISYYAFENCPRLALTSLPDGLTTINNYAFRYCVGLTTLTIGSAIKTIGTTAFEGCTNLETIIINRAEGTVSGAPWGATNATVQWIGTN